MSTYNASNPRKNAALPGGRYPISDTTHARQAVREINAGALDAAKLAKVTAQAKRFLKKAK